MNSPLELNEEVPLLVEIPSLVLESNESSLTNSVDTPPLLLSFPPSPNLSSESPPPSPKLSSHKFYRTPTAGSIPIRANRQSLMALGKIQFLQHSFARRGLTSKEEVRPRLGVSALTGGIGLEEEEEENQFLENKLTIENLPPSPEKPTVDSRMPWEIEQLSTIKGEKELKRSVISLMEIVIEKWELEGIVLFVNKRVCSTTSSLGDAIESSVHDSPNGKDQEKGKVGLLDLLEITTSCIRAVQHYCHNLPPLSQPTTTTTTTTESDFITISNQFESKPNKLSIHPNSLAHKTSAVNLGVNAVPLNSITTSKELRKISLDLLGSLKAMELNHRTSDFDVAVEEEEEEEEEEVPMLIRGDSSEGSISPDESFTSIPSPKFNYKSIKLDEVSIEKSVVMEYIELVDKILFKDRSIKLKQRKSNPKSSSSTTSSPILKSTEDGSSQEEIKKSSPVRHRRNPKLGSVEGIQFEDNLSSDDEEESEGDLPSWAGLDQKDGLERVYSVLMAHLTKVDSSKLVNPNTSLAREIFLESLSDGNLLCLAYNSILRSSSRAFGFIPTGSIHSLQTIESELKGEAKVGMTFRKIENLQIWSAALKFRYLINLSNVNSKETNLNFEPKFIARRLENWLDRLEFSLLTWINFIVEEKREEISILH